MRVIRWLGRSFHLPTVLLLQYREYSLWIYGDLVKGVYISDNRTWFPFEMNLCLPQSRKPGSAEPLNSTRCGCFMRTIQGFLGLARKLNSIEDLYANPCLCLNTSGSIVLLDLVDLPWGQLQSVCVWQSSLMLSLSMYFSLLPKSFKSVIVTIVCLL